MTDAGWAEKIIEKARLNYSDGEPSSFININQARTMLLSEHARAIRLVKAEIKRVELDDYSHTEETRKMILYSLNKLLAALQRGRGGKG
jgi:hypothetical protein